MNQQSDLASATTTFNILNITTLRDYLSWLNEPSTQPDIGFNMNTYCGPSDIKTKDMTGHECGTVACIAGHACFLYTEAAKPKKGFWSVSEYYHVAKDLLGLTDGDARFLFSGGFSDDLDQAKISVTSAITELNYMIVHGQVSG